MPLNTIDTKYYLDTIDRLKNGKASDPDKVTINLLKDAAKFIAYNIIFIFNSLITNGVFLMCGKQRVLHQFISQDLSQT